MADLDIPVFAAEEVVVLHDRDYVLWLVERLRTARSRILAVQFIADVRPQVDDGREVRAVAELLARAAWRGLDVRLVLSRFVGADAVAEPNRVLARWLAPRGVGTRLYKPRDSSRRANVHSKFVVIDDHWVVTGSHNWTPGAFRENHEQSIAVRSTEVAARLRSTFEGYWENGEEAAPGADTGAGVLDVEEPR